MRSGRLPLLVAVLAASAAALTPASAAPLDAESCAKLETEHNDLEGAGVVKDMEKGPDWAKANLGLEKLQRVQRFIELEELLMFRCRSRAIVHLTPEREWSTDQDGDDKDDKDDDDKGAAPKPGTAPAKAAADPKQNPDAGKQSAPAAKPVAAPKKPAKAAGQPAEPGVTSIEKRPAPKAKADDALKVPPPDPSVDPFASQLKLPAR
jgi:hypothetical protein